VSRVAAIVVVAVVAVASCTADRALVSASQVTTDQQFVLTLTAGRPIYRSTESIEMTASIEYVGSAAGIDISYLGQPVIFGVFEVDGGRQMVPAVGQGCQRRTLGRGQPVAVDFHKSEVAPFEGGEAFDAAWYVEPTLHLPRGRWQIVAQSVALQPDCETLLHQLETSIEILVQP
jgi:hypothetical protein